MQEAFETGHVTSVFDVFSVTALDCTENPSASLGRVYLHCLDGEIGAIQHLHQLKHMEMRGDGWIEA
jgi:hypothetical protein